MIPQRRRSISAPHLTARSPETRPSDPPRLVVDGAVGLAIASIDERFTVDVLGSRADIDWNSAFGGRGTAASIDIQFPALLGDLGPVPLGLAIDLHHAGISGDARGVFPNGIAVLADPVATRVSYRARSDTAVLSLVTDSGWDSRHQGYAAAGLGLAWSRLDVRTTLVSPAVGGTVTASDRQIDLAPVWQVRAGYRYLLSDTSHLFVGGRVQGINGGLYGSDGRSSLLLSVAAGGGMRF